MACLDVEGGRHHRAASAFQMPHIHALLLAHPTSGERFRQPQRSGILEITAGSRISTTEIRPFRDHGQSADPMVTYTAKYARETIGDDRLHKTWAAFPTMTADLYPLYGDADSYTFRTGPHRTRCSE